VYPKKHSWLFSLSKIYLEYNGFLGNINNQYSGGRQDVTFDTFCYEKY